VIICQLIVRLLVIAQNKKQKENTKEIKNKKCCLFIFLCDMK